MQEAAKLQSLKGVSRKVAYSTHTTYINTVRLATKDRNPNNSEQTERECTKRFKSSIEKIIFIFLAQIIFNLWF